MEEVNFNRQPFVTVQDHQRGIAIPRVIGGLFLAAAFAALAFLGYRLVIEYSGSSAATRPALDQVQEQLAGIEKRIDQLEQHHRTLVANPKAAPEASAASVPAGKLPTERRAYKVTSASVVPPQAEPNSHVTSMQPNGTAQRPTAQSVQPLQIPSAQPSADKDEVWQATADRLSDVVGVVGTQQGEISKTREELNVLLAQTRRKAMPFELRRGAGPEPVGPVSLVLKNSDAKNLRYTVCVAFESQCVELKNRAVNEVVVFVLSDKSAPMELVATKVLHDQIVGYLEVPDKPLP
jgi:hypothetical protein